MRRTEDEMRTFYNEVYPNCMDLRFFKPLGNTETMVADFPMDRAIALVRAKEPEVAQAKLWWLALKIRMMKPGDKLYKLSYGGGLTIREIKEIRHRLNDSEIICKGDLKLSYHTVYFDTVKVFEDESYPVEDHWLVGHNYIIGRINAKIKERASHDHKETSETRVC